MTSLAAWTLEPLAAEIATDVLLKATVLLGLAWGAARLLRHASAATRHGLWTLALIGLLAVPLLSICLPAWTVGLPAPVRDLAVRTTAPLPLTRTAVTRAARETRIADPGTDETATMPGTLASPASPPVAVSLALIVLLLWACGALVLLGRLALHMARTLRLAQRAETLQDGPRASEARRQIRRLGIRRPVRVVSSADVPMAMTWGAWRPVVLFPDEARRWSDERYRMVLLHELAHVKRWDYACHLAAQVARALYWFNPLVWIATRRLYLEQERACDDYVLRAGTGACDYAAHLVDIARSLLRRPAPTADGIAMARRSTLKERVQAILNTGSNRRALSLRTGLTTAGASLCLVLPLAALQIGPAPDGFLAPALPEAQTADNAPGYAPMRDAPLATLLAALDDVDPAVRARGVRALGVRGDAAALDRLEAALHDTCPDVRAAVVRALDQVCACKALAVVPAALDDPNPTVRLAAADVLHRRIEALQADNSPDAERALRRGLPGAVRALVDALDDDHAPVRQAVAAALGAAGDPDAAEALKGVLHDASPLVRQAAARALGRLGLPCTAPALRPALQDEHPAVRTAAARALGRLTAS